MVGYSVSQIGYRVSPLASRLGMTVGLDGLGDMSIELDNGRPLYWMTCGLVLTMASKWIG